MRYFVLFLAFFVTISAQAAEIHTTARQAILIDLSTDTILFEKNADERVPTASMSKVMTMSMVFEALQKNMLSLDDKLLVSAKAWKKRGSRMFVEVGHKVLVEDLIRGVIVQSGNDAAIVLAEGIAGSEEEFARMMTARAQALGMKNSNFTNASGWPDPNHYSTIRDLSILARHVILDQTKFYAYYAEKEFRYNNITQKNRNPLLYKSINADGLKTGHTEESGYGLIGSAVQNGRRLLVVLNGFKSKADRAAQSERLLNWGFRAFEAQDVIVAGDEIDEAPVWFGEQNQLPLLAGESVRLTLLKDKSEKPTLTLKMVQPVPAPVKKGQVLGTLLVQSPNGTTHEIPVLAGRSVEKVSGVFRIIKNLKALLSSS